MQRTTFDRTNVGPINMTEQGFEISVLTKPPIDSKIARFSVVQRNSAEDDFQELNLSRCSDDKLERMSDYWMPRVDQTELQHRLSLINCINAPEMYLKGTNSIPIQF